MARKYQSTGRSGYTVLIIDDSPDILESTRRLLESEGHRVLTAPDGPTGLGVLQQEHVHLILVDYFMPIMTGEEVVRRVRESNPLVQIILQTGYAGEKPARVMMRELEIQGYHDKSEGGEHLLLWVDTALKTYRHVLAMEKHRKGLRYILHITPELHRMQPITELLQSLLSQIEGLLGAENCFVATFAGEPKATQTSEGFVALIDPVEAERDLRIRFGTGRFRDRATSAVLPESHQELIDRAIREGAICIESDASVVPLMLGSRALGVIFLDRDVGFQKDRELLEVFAFQAAAAIQNSLLYDLATIDSLTGVYLRGFAMLQLQQAIKRSSRHGDPLSLLMIDLDRFKQINDTHGHQVGDRALRAVGDLLRSCVRETDIVGRYGGDEFMVVLPDSPGPGALIVANRILARAASLSVEADGQSVPIRLSVGVGTLVHTPEELATNIEPGALTGAAESLVECADRALYAAKGTGHVGERNALSWNELFKVSQD